ncbi:hypothetical protein HQQ94_03680 [Shewanella sp. VB17]|uniref:hypothetical protein n=1 Tax=Shewanella sp. VB17 TaxID=2739432 RepID=UPI0015640EEB|nr:hypothetical protein [Shewanella sp. VB17]NRD72356.1 hypothetical protein [Shewanella sp. VB17]
MNIILVTDIFGSTESISLLQKRIEKTGCQSTIVDPFNGVNKHFKSEPLAYQTFLAECGHDKYCDLLTSKIENTNGPSVVVGFSAGASAAWKSLVMSSHAGVAHFIGFYPSQIRYHLDVCPQLPVSLIFPAVEPHFEIDEVIKVLSIKPEVYTHKTDFNHGFMNPLSSEYSANAAGYYIDILCQVSLLMNITDCRR